MPAEWEEHEATWLSWPKNRETFPRELLPAVERAYVQMIDALSKGERVDLLVDDDATKERVSGMVESTGNVRFHLIKTADVWIRDYGPLFVRDGDVAATKWLFNAWGMKYEDLLPDNSAGSEVARASGLRTFEAGIVLEGGSVEVNGAGTCITTEQCLLNGNRNPELGRRELEGYLSDFLGATNVIWLGSGIAGDDTDGHIDDIARFVGERRVICMVQEERGDENRARLEENARALALARDQDGERLDVIEMAMPREVQSRYGRLPASYANFYVGNSAVLLPTYGDRNDDRALSAVRELFPGRDVVGIECTPLVHGLGSIHCVTQQQPSPMRRPQSSPSPRR